MLAVVIVVELVYFDARFIVRQWRASRIKHRRTAHERSILDKSLYKAPDPALKAPAAPPRVPRPIR